MSQPCSGRGGIPQVSWRVSVGARRRAAIFSRHLHANQSALERDGCAVPIDVAVSGGQALLSAGQGGLRPAEIDLRGKLRSFRQNGHAVPQDLRKSADDGEMRRFLAAHVVIAQLPDTQLGDQRRMPWQDTEVAISAGKLYFLGALAKLLLPRRNYH